LSPATSPQLAPNLVDCVHRAVGSTLEAVTGDRPTPRQAEGSDDVLACDGIIGVISLVGDLEWSLVLGLPPDTAPALAEGFAGFPIAFASADMGDAIGELTNLIAGEVKVELDAAGTRVNISLPQVFRGMGIEILKLPHIPCQVLVYDHACGPLLVAIAAGR
jgi:CheY-specific phosphatase CheX